MKQDKLYLYTINMKYVRDLHNVDDSVIKKLNVKIDKSDAYSEKAYKILCSKELDWVQKNQDAIIKKANKLYKMICQGYANSNLKKRCLDFSRLEKVLIKWKNKK